MKASAGKDANREFTQTSWPVVELGTVCGIQLGKMLSPKSKRGTRPVPYLRNVNVQWARFDLADVAWMDFDELEEEKFRLKPGDLLVCEGGEPGRAAIWQGEIERCCYQKSLHRIRPRTGLAHPPFVMYRLWLSSLAGDFTNSQTQTTIAHLPLEKLVCLPIPLPPLQEQELIAGLLSEQLATVSSARMLAQSRFDAAQALATAYLREAFGEMPPLSAAVIQPSEPTRPDWRWRPLTDLARLATGHTPSRREPSWWGGDIHWLQLPDIRAVDGRRVRSTLEQTNEIGLANSAAVLLPEGTVCMSRTASVGFVSILGRAMATSQDFVNWVCGRELDPDFLMYLILRCRSEIRALGSGATHHSIYFETVENFSVCIPPIAEQRRIAADLASRFAEAEQLAKLIRDEVAALEALPAALMREAFQQAI